MVRFIISFLIYCFRVPTGLVTSSHSSSSILPLVKPLDPSHFGKLLWLAYFLLKMLLRIGQKTSDGLTRWWIIRLILTSIQTPCIPVKHYKITWDFIAALFPYCLMVWPTQTPNFNTCLAVKEVSPVLDLVYWLPEVHQGSFMLPPWDFLLLVLILRSTQPLLFPTCLGFCFRLEGKQKG